MEYLLFVSGILFLISSGSISKHREENSDSMMENSVYGKMIVTIFTLIAFILFAIIVNTLLDFKWYWNFIISIIIYVFTRDILSSIYSFFVGYKSKPQISLSAGGYVKYNLYYIDALITFGLGLIVYLIGK